MGKHFPRKKNCPVRSARIATLSGRAFRTIFFSWEMFVPPNIGLHRTILFKWLVIWTILKSVFTAHRSSPLGGKHNPPIWTALGQSRAGRPESLRSLAEPALDCLRTVYRRIMHRPSPPFNLKIASPPRARFIWSTSRRGDFAPRRGVLVEPRLWKKVFLLKKRRC